MQDIKITYAPGSGLCSQISVDGVDYGQLTRSVVVEMEAGRLAEVTIELQPRSCSIDLRGLVTFDLSADVPEDTAREIYQQLKKRFEPDEKE